MSETKASKFLGKKTSGIVYLAANNDGGKFLKRIKIPISASADGELTSFQVRLTIVKGAGTSEAGTIYLNDATNWPYGIRFTASDGYTSLDFWREEYDATDGTWIVEIPTIAATGDTDIYLYYSSSNAPDASDGLHTFPFYGTTADWLNRSKLALVRYWGATANKIPAARAEVAIAANEGKYEAWPALAKLADGTKIIVYRTADNNTHTYDATGKLVIKKSADGITWGSEIVVANSGHDDVDGGLCVYTWNGVETIICSYTERNAAVAGLYRAYVRKSIDGGATWGEKISLGGDISRATHGCPIFLSNSRLIVPVYAEANDFGILANYSDDGGDTWTEVTVEAGGVIGPNETTMIELKTNGVYAGKVLRISRAQWTGYDRRLYRYSISYDYGLTWSAAENFNLANTTATPCRLRRFDNGELYLIFSPQETYLNRISIFKCVDEDNVNALGSWTWCGSVQSSTLNHSFYSDLIELTATTVGVCWCSNDATSDVYFDHLTYPFPEFAGYEDAYAVGDNMSFLVSPEYMVTWVNYGPEVVLEWQAKDVSGELYHPFEVGFGRYISGYSLNCARKIKSSAGTYACVVTAASTRSITSATAYDLDNFHKFKLIWSAGLVQLFQDGVQKGANLTTNIPSDALPIVIGPTFSLDDTDHENGILNYIFMRKYTANEPAWAAPGAVETVVAYL